MKKSELSAIALAVFAAAGLAACGGGGETKIFPAPVIDSFFAAVSGIVSTTSEDGSPKDPIDAIAVTAPEDKEPEPLG